MYNTTARSLAAIFTLLVGSSVAFCSKPVEAQALISNTILSGQPAPGTPSGVNLLSFSDPVLNDSGQLAFRASVSGLNVGLNNDQAVFAQANGRTLSLVAREGNQVIGESTGVNFGTPFNPVLNNAGQTAFGTILSGGNVSPVNDRALFSEGEGAGLSLLAREGSQVPGELEGRNFQAFFDNPALNSAGQTAFLTSLVSPGAGSDTRIFRQDLNGGLVRIAAQNSLAPDTGVNFGVQSNPVLNSSGDVAFQSFLNVNTGSGTENAQVAFGIFSSGLGADLRLVARAGDQAPGLGSGVNFAILGSPVINDAGETAFRSSLTGLGIEGVFAEDRETGLRLVAAGGFQVPDTSRRLEFRGFDDPVLNTSGNTAFRASITTNVGANPSVTQAIFSEGFGGTLRLVAEEGQQAVGFSEATVFSSFSTPVLNGVGQTAFLGRLTGPGNNTGIFATDLNGDLQVVVRTGDIIDVDQNPLIEDPATIVFLSFETQSGGEDGRRVTFNNAGQLAFRFILDDGRQGVGIAVIPEPSALALSLPGVLAMLVRRQA